MSVCFAAGMPMMRAIAFAVSTSDATTKSTSSWRSRQMSRYSTFIVRTIVFALESARASIAATMLASSRDVQAMTRSAFAIPASCSARRLAPFASTVTTSYRWARGLRRA